MADYPVAYHHLSVMLSQSVDALITDREGIYVDATFGGGGHSRAILDRLGRKGKLIAFDHDPAVTNHLLEDERFLFVPSNFRYLKKYLQYYKSKPIDGLLLDLGVSSAQLDQPQRGFSFRNEGAVDMRMNPRQARSAQHVLMHYSKAQLETVWKEFGELRNARKIAELWCRDRHSRWVQSGNSFSRWVEGFSYGNKMQFLARVFQALRIEVNQEMQALREVLEQASEVIKPNGRLVILTYHSLEDRLAKQWTKYGNPVAPKAQFKPMFVKPIVPNDEEIKYNSRARSAKMRVGIKI